MKKVTQEPIRSYKAYFNATVKPDDQPIPKPRKLLQGSKYYEKKLERHHHTFDHMRIEKQLEVEGFTAWRGKCRGVVSTYFAENEKDGPVLEQQLDVYGRRENPHLQRSVQDRSSGVQNSVWTTKAMHLAVAEERRRICQSIEDFKLDFVAATLSREAMETLRREVLVKIRAKPCIDYKRALFSKQDFMKFLVQRNTARKGGPLPVFSTTAGPVDVVDAMASPAEAAFAKFVLKVLPT